MIWSSVLAIIGIVGLWLAGQKMWAGWAVGLFAQVVWVVYAIATDQYGFIVSAIAYATVYGMNLHKWLLEPPRKDEK